MINPKSLKFVNNADLVPITMAFSPFLDLSQMKNFSRLFNDECNTSIGTLNLSLNLFVV